MSDLFVLRLTQLQFGCKIENKLFGLFPAEARIRDRLPEDVLAHALRAVFYVALDHKAFDQMFDILAALLKEL